jgi:signal peptide peptidase SppA
MKILDIVTSPWAIMPDRLIEIQEIYMTHLRGEKIDLAGIEARLGRPLNNEPKPYEVENGVAVLALDGVISKRMNIFQKISGGVSSELARRDFLQAMADPEVHSIVLYIDSPGGAVDGTQELAREIYNARGSGKNLVAFSDGLMASAAYWIGAQAHRVYISGDTVTVGSVGVVARHIDVSQMEQRMGVKTTEITAGRYKRAASEYEPLSETGRRTIQEMLDHIYGIFLADVAKARPQLSLEPVKSGKEESIPWADGRLFLGSQAIDAGLVDGVATLADLIASLSDDPSRYLARAAWIRAQHDRR